MSNPSKQKGSRFEREVADYIADNSPYPDCDRRILTGSQDKGDLCNTGGWTLELKNHKNVSTALREATDQAEKEAAHADTRWFAAIVKRPRKNVSKAYVVQPLNEWCERELYIADLERKVKEIE